MNSKPEEKTTISRESPTPLKTVKSEELFAVAKEIFILHDEQQYRLRLTADGKLILTK